jgi:dTDP-4-dehydrorhamnose reductase
MSPTATAFIARAVVTFLEREGPGGVYHCVNAGATSWAGFARAIVLKAGVAATVTGCATAEWPTPARRPAYSALDNARLAGVVGPIPHWRDALATYLTAKGHV